MNDYIDIIINAVTAIAAVVAAVIAKNTLTQSRREQKEGLDRQKKQDTIDAYNRLQEQVLDKINEYKPAEIRRIVEDNEPGEIEALGGYLAKIEHFCVGLTNDIYDYETFYALAHGYFDSEKGMLMPRLLPIIEKKLIGSDVDYFENLHIVWKKMSEMTKEKEAK